MIKDYEKQKAAISSGEIDKTAPPKQQQPATTHQPAYRGRGMRAISNNTASRAGADTSFQSKNEPSDVYKKTEVNNSSKDNSIPEQTDNKQYRSMATVFEKKDPY